MKYIFSLIIICILACGSTLPIAIEESREYQIDSEGKILWSSNEKLNWVDFKGVINNHETNVLAETQCEIKIVNSYWNDNLPRYDIRCYFIKSKSWTTVADTLTLNHEQLHFDIYELYTRKIRKEFEKLSLKKESNIDKYNSIYIRLVSEAIKENKNYDSEVYFNDIKQQEWIDKVGKELEDLKEFEYIPKE